MEVNNHNAFCDILSSYSVLTLPFLSGTMTGYSSSVVNSGHSYNETNSSPYHLKKRKEDSTSILTQNKTLDSGVSTMFILPLMPFMKASTQYFHEHPKGKNLRADLYHRNRMMFGTLTIVIESVC